LEVVIVAIPELLSYANELILIASPVNWANAFDVNCVPIPSVEPTEIEDTTVIVIEEGRMVVSGAIVNSIYD
jgi:hypothetical protein